MKHCVSLMPYNFMNKTAMSVRQIGTKAMKRLTPRLRELPITSIKILKNSDNIKEQVSPALFSAV